MTGNNKCLLDTSIIIKALKRNAIVGKNLDTLKKIYVPLTAVGELFHGAYKSTRLAVHLQEMDRFLAKCTILSPDRQTAEIYGKTKADLMEKGKPIPENDIWIAAIALQHDLSLYENDKHFWEVDSL